MMSKHTPGPWRIGRAGPNGCQTVGTEKGLMTAMIAHSVNYPDQREQAIANARLIAAAPDLLEFAKTYMDQFRGYQITNTQDAKHDATGWLRDLARAAIAKAEGAAPALLPDAYDATDRSAHMTDCASVPK